jgi:hypothetical protein
MISHQVTFSPSGRSTLVPGGATILQAAEVAGEPISHLLKVSPRQSTVFPEAAD